jgi:hypothetical protein
MRQQSSQRRGSRPPRSPPHASLLPPATSRSDPEVPAQTDLGHVTSWDRLKSFNPLSYRNRGVVSWKIQNFLTRNVKRTRTRRRLTPRRPLTPDPRQPTRKTYKRGQAQGGRRAARATCWCVLNEV